MLKLAIIVGGLRRGPNFTHGCKRFQTTNLMQRGKT